MYVATLARIGESIPYYAEGMFAFVTPDGDAYLASAFVDSQMSMRDVDLASSDFSGALMGILILHDTSVATLPPILSSPALLGRMFLVDLPNEILQNLTKYYELIPKTIFLIAYVDVDANTARRRADSAASRFFTSFGAQS